MKKSKQSEEIVAPERRLKHHVQFGCPCGAFAIHNDITMISFPGGKVPCPKCGQPMTQIDAPVEIKYSDE